MYGVIDMSDESNVSYPDGTTSSALDFRPNDLVAGSEAAQWIANANALDMSAVAAPEKPGFADALIRAVDAEGNWSLSPYSIRMCLATVSYTHLPAPKFSVSVLVFQLAELLIQHCAALPFQIPHKVRY